ncbi:hypothetical protein [Streptomyces sp. NPDC058457]|uniref:hypothetical protein n=1 Tax=Streptomyces sp. NPDC058457 TaxID=3346507 RepID=UPI003662E5B0
MACTGRFHDFLFRDDDEWTLVLRQPVYGKDRLDVADPAVSFKPAPELLARFPFGYRHLGYVQTKAGFTLKLRLTGLAHRPVAALPVRPSAITRYCGSPRELLARPGCR